jgi:hypothetical protein
MSTPTTSEPRIDFAGSLPVVYRRQLHLSQAAAELTGDQLAAVVAVTVAINGWNRIAVSTRLPAGSYVARD